MLVGILVPLHGVFVYKVRGSGLYFWSQLFYHLWHLHFIPVIFITFSSLPHVFRKFYDSIHIYFVIFNLDVLFCSFRNFIFRFIGSFFSRGPWFGSQINLFGFTIIQVISLSQIAVRNLNPINFVYAACIIIFFRIVGLFYVRVG
jgi:hypothetical protein